MPRTNLIMDLTPISKSAQVAICLSFLFLVIVPHVMELSGSGGNTESTEQREIAKAPDAGLIFKSFPEYARQFDSYYSDTFGIRDKLIGWNAFVRLHTFDDSPQNMKARVGKDGWFFFADEMVMQDYANVIPFTPDDLKNIGRILKERYAWLEAKGIKLFILVAPNTHTIYGEYLPSNIHKIGKESRLDQVKAYLERYPELEFVDVRETLFKAKPTQRLYHKTDTHWNAYGAFLGYEELMDRVRLHFPAIKKLSLDDFDVQIQETGGGDLARMLSLQDRLVEHRVKLVPKFVPMARDVANSPADPFAAQYSMIVKENDDQYLPKAVVFHDSFTIALVPYLAESFGRLVFVRTSDFLPELIEREKPDLVIIQYAERLLKGLLKKNPAQVRAALNSSQ